MRNLSKKSKAIIAGAAIAGLASAGGAYAYWTTTGGGIGSASAGTTVSVTMAQVGSISGLTPDSTPQDVDFSITNPATTNQFIGSVTVAMTGVTGVHIDTAHPCTTADFALTPSTATPDDLANGTHNYAHNGSTLQLVNHTWNQDGCKDAIVALSFTANAS